MSFDLLNDFYESIFEAFDRGVENSNFNLTEIQLILSHDLS